MRAFARKLLPALLLAIVAGLTQAQETGALAVAKAQSQQNDSFLGKMRSRVGEAVKTTSSGMSSLIDTGLGYLGVKYLFGGTGPSAGGFDCSGLIKKVFGDAIGLSLPRTAAEMAQLGEKVGRQNLKPGDLVFFNTMNRTFSHAGIYLGDNQFLHAPSSGGVVRVDSMEVSYWRQRFTGARRLLISDAQAEPLSISE